MRYLELIQENYMTLLSAMGNTLLLTLLSLIFASVLGLIFGMMNVSKNRILNLIGTVYVDAIRGVPLIVLAYFIYFGLPYGKAMRKVILPQAIRTMIPSFINQFIITLKDTSILSVIGFPELTKAGNIIVGRNFEVMRMWAIIAVMYLIVITVLSRFAKYIERRMALGK